MSPISVPYQSPAPPDPVRRAHRPSNEPDTVLAKDRIEWCLKNQCVITPTLPLLVNIIEASEGAAGVSAMEAFQREVDAAVKNLPRAYRAGVPLIQGSESGWSPVPYGEWHAREMEIFVTYLGLSPLEAIHTGTFAPTRIMRRFGHEVGKLERGRYADIVVVNGDPTVDITRLQRPKEFDFIFKAGRPIDRTPPAPAKQWYYERHKIFLNGIFHYDPEAGRGVLVR